MDKLRKTFVSLRNRNFRLFFISQMISNTGNWLTNVALTLLVLKITRSGLAVGLLAACQYGPILLLSAWAGARTDRTDKRMMLVWTQSLEMLQSAGLAVMAFMPHPPVAGLYILAAAGGIFLAFDNPLRRSFVSEMVPEKDIANAVVVNSTTVNVPRIFGPALAGLLVVTVGYGWCFTIDAASYIAVIISLLMMIPKELHRTPPRPRQRGEVREGLRYILSIPSLWISFVMLAVIGTLAYNFSVTLPLFVTSSLHGNDTTFTIIYVLFSCGAVASSLIVAHRNLVKMEHIIWGALALGVTMIMLGLAPTLSLAIPCAFLLGLSGILFMTSTTTMVQVETDKKMLGRVLAIQTVLVIGTTPIGGPLSGWLSDLAGGRAPILLGGVASLLAALFGYLAVKKYVKVN